MYIAIDNETGGIGVDKVSLLSAYFAVYDKDLKFVADLDLFLKPNDGVFRVEGEALGVNKIDLVEHTKIAKTYSEGGQLLFHFLKEHSQNGQLKLIPIGHNVTFDLLFIYTQLVNRTTFEQFVSYRKLDTGVIGQFLKLCGKLPETVSAGLDSLADYFGIVQTAKHTGKGDVETTVEILRRMQEIGMPTLIIPKTNIAPDGVAQ